MTKKEWELTQQYKSNRHDYIKYNTCQNAKPIRRVAHKKRQNNKQDNIKLDLPSSKIWRYTNKLWKQFRST